MATCLPAVVFGARRVFNYKMPSDNERYGPPVDPLARAALNVRMTDDPADLVNGVVINIALDDIPATRTREVAYDLVPAACLDWRRLSQPLSVVYVLRCPESPWEGRNYTDAQLAPHREYYSVCRDGAMDFGARFLELWLATTYLADGVTPVAKWETTDR